MSWCVLAGNKTGTGWGTVWGVGISAGKADTPTCELIDVRRLVEPAAKATQVPPTKVVDKNENNVGLSFKQSLLAATNTAI